MTKSTKPIPASRGISFQQILLLLATLGIVIFCLAPILWQVLTSVKLNRDISAVPTVYFPTQFTFDRYIELFTRYPFWRYILNSAFVSI
ncbi:MAG: hypothetical protein RLZZ135_1920, partial [Cyanobacteriota bacterium]